MKQPARVVILWAAAAVSLPAQNISGALSGTVTDALGSAFAGCQIEVRNEQTGFVRVTSSNATGFFSVPDLTPGEYSLTVAARGFKQYSQTGIAVSSGDQRSLGNIALQVGSTSESITVTAEAVPVQLGSSERAGTLTQSDLQSMALRGRDLMDAV
ncbi:MAG TPA: carboxypeptidase-like regulatory domain-containing protein, partial [Bryobacteraceae bacterium]|nr:carboxypeptidase-like regulatory domain-containing protein [Bryobacteraceae bacterium]